MAEILDRVKLEEKLDGLSGAAQHLAIELEREGYPALSHITSSRQLSAVLGGPIGAPRFRDDTQVTGLDGDGRGWCRILTPSSPLVTYNEVFFSSLATEITDQEIDAIISEYRQHGLGFAWCVYPWTRPADLGAKLVARGATESPMLTFIGQSAFNFKMVPGTEIEVIEPVATESYREYIDLTAEGTGLPPEDAAFRYRHYRELMSGPEPFIRLLLARVGGEAAGTMMVVLKKASAHLSGLYVKREFQARGIFLSLNCVAHELVSNLGIDIVTGHSNAMSAFWLQRFGATPAYRYNFYQFAVPD